MNKEFQNHSKDAVRIVSDKINISLPDSTFCILPFSHLSTTINGEIRLCCRSKPVGNIEDSDILELWNSQRLNTIRQRLLTGEKVSECSNCWKMEEKGIASLRNGQNIARTDLFKNEIKSFIDGHDLKLPTLELKLSNRCNLQCKMCSPVASTKWVKPWEPLKQFYEKDYTQWVDKTMTKSGNLDLFLTNTNFMNSLSEISKDLQIVDFAGGEPLIDPLHYKILEKIIEQGNSQNTTLRYSTNLTVLSLEKFHVISLWSQFKEIHLTISIDGFPGLNEYIRKGTQSEKLEENLQTVKEIEQVTLIKGTTTLNAYNSLFTKETAEYILGHLEIGWHTSRVTSPDFLDARIWPEEIKEEAIHSIESLDLSQFSLPPQQYIQAQRHISDYVAWMGSVLENRESLFERFLNFTKKNDLMNKTDYFSFLNKNRIDFFQPRPLS